jgi:hypothetical protein
MTQRTWFKPENTDGDVDLITLNRAARIMEDDQTKPLTRLELMAIRAAYKPNLSANQIAIAAEELLTYQPDGEKT